jgi:hypothetical protein
MILRLPPLGTTATPGMVAAAPPCTSETTRGRNEHTVADDRDKEFVGSSEDDTRSELAEDARW